MCSSCSRSTHTASRICAWTGASSIALAEQVGPSGQVLGVDVDRLLHDDELPAWTLEALDEHGVLVFRGLHLDDATQVAFNFAGAGGRPAGIYLPSSENVWGFATNPPTASR